MVVIGTYTLDDLIRIMQTLRGKNGCPWDKQQTHETLKKYLIEECYETIDALTQKDPQKIAEELGDVLLQIVFHAQIGAEAGTFTIDDVIRSICEKLILRHPHVFGDVSVKDADEVTENWQKIKQKEQDIKTHTQNLKAVPQCLPSLIRAQKVQKRAGDAGFDFKDANEAYRKLLEEAKELQTEFVQMDPARLEDEVGDVLFSVVNVARFLQVDCEEALSHSTQKFITRFEYVEKKAVEQNKTMEQLSFQEVDMIWEESKKK